MKKSLKPSTSMAPVPIALVSCGNMKKSNIITIAWTGIISSEPPIVYVSIRPNRYSYNIIKESKEFVINLPCKNIVKEVDYCGTNTGENIDKFLECKFTKEKAEKMQVPIIKECPINLECKVKEIKNYGSHDMFIAEVVNINVDEEYVDEYGIIDYNKAETVGYVGKKYCTISNEIGKIGFSKNN